VGKFKAWYVNLERVHVVADWGIETGDHILDLIIGPDGQHQFKDEDELAAAVAAGRWTAADARQFRLDADRALELFANGAPCFALDWTRLDPDAEGPILMPDSWFERLLTVEA
jgi:predicted RNA-binding protein associated with RNAse of E/G family